MPRRMTQRQAKRSGRQPSVQPAESATIYRGPLRLTGPVKLPAVTVPLTYTGNISSSGSGQVLFSLSNDPRSATEWSLCAGLYTEFRVLSTLLEYVPYQHYFQSTTPVNSGPVIWYSFHNANSVDRPATFDAAAQLSNRTFKSADTPHKESVRMTGTPESSWVNVTAVAGSGFDGSYASIGMVSGTGVFTNSVAIGQYIVTLMVQFRERS